MLNYSVAELRLKKQEAMVGDVMPLDFIAKSINLSEIQDQKW